MRAAVGWTACAPIDEAGTVIEVDAQAIPLSEGNFVVEGGRLGLLCRLALIDAWNPSTQASMMRSISSGLRSKKAAISPSSVRTSAKGRRASRMAFASMSVLSIIPLFLWRKARAGVEAAHRAEVVMWEAIPVQLLAVAEAARLPAAERAGANPSSSVRIGIVAGPRRPREALRLQHDPPRDGGLGHRLEIGHASARRWAA